MINKLEKSIAYWFYDKIGIQMRATTIRLILFTFVLFIVAVVVLVNDSGKTHYQGPVSPSEAPTGTVE